MTIELRGGFETSPYWKGVSVEVRNRLADGSRGGWSLTLRPANACDPNYCQQSGEGCAEINFAARHLLMIFPTVGAPLDAGRAAGMICALVLEVLQEEVADVRGDGRQSN